jgi:hypothetical protein
MTSCVRHWRAFQPRRAVSVAAFVVAATIGVVPQHALGAQGMGAQPYPADSSGPLSLHFKGVTLTPGGYFAGEAFWRQKNETADMGSSYNAIPFSGTTNAAMSEFRGSARQSRISLLAVGNAGDVKLSGYYEMDFLGAGTTSNSSESDGYVMRIRQFWGQVNLSSGWNFAAGQMWSLITTNKMGMSPRAEWVPLTIDAQYVPGFNWARQFELRVWKDLGKTAAFGLAVDGAQTTFAARNPPNNFILGMTGGSQLNQLANYSTDLAPDLIAKLSLDPGFGHYEIKAIGRVFRDRVIDVSDTLGGSHNSMVYGGGLGAAALWSAYNTEDGKKRDILDFGISGLWGSGIGRYASSQLPDATVRPNGDIVPILSASALVGVEAHPHRQLDIYAYGGVDYADQTAFLSSSVPPKGVGYGSPLNNNVGCATEAAPGGQYTAGAVVCNADTRALWQMTAGFWYRFLQGSYGTFSWGLQYSYTSRNTWAGLNGLQPQAIDPMLFTSLRYYLP